MSIRRLFIIPMHVQHLGSRFCRALGPRWASTLVQEALGPPSSAEPPLVEAAKKEPILDAQGRAYGTGRRKTSVARVWIYPGTGTVTVNSMSLIDRFPRNAHCDDIVAPFGVTATAGAFDVWATVKGGGCSGQAGALRLGIARALENFDPDLRPPLRKAGYLTRDSRRVERKKPGLVKARKAPQWVKR